MTKEREAGEDGPHIHYLEMGPWPVYVGFTESEEAFDKEMLRLGITNKVPFVGNGGNAAATAHLFENTSGSTCAIITIAGLRGRPRPAVASLIAHEAVHVVQYIREEINRNEPLGDEAEAYIVQYIVEEILVSLWRPSKVRASTVPPTYKGR